MEVEMREHNVASYETMSVQALALKAKSGDREARNILFLRLQSEILNSIHRARQLLGNLNERSGPIEEQDIDQQAFLMFCKVLDNWQPRRKAFVPYMKILMRWYAVDYVNSTLHVRSRRVRIVRMPEKRQMSARNALCALLGPAELVESSEEWYAILAQLSLSWRRFVSMKFYEGLSSRQIARANHCSTRTVNRTLHAALELLRHNSQEEWEAL
jgi:RNA polymerase sigma factor (sigma-70 family)